MNTTIPRIAAVLYRTRYPQRSLQYGLGCVALASTLGAACADSLKVSHANLPPVAVARVVGNDSPTPSFDYEGSKVEVKLDGSHSSDPDGKIAIYRWLNTTLTPKAAVQAGAAGTAGTPAGNGSVGVGGASGAGGVRSRMPARWIPEGEDASWPEDTEQPEVMLDKGTYSFTLWVIDDAGKVSDPSTITITVGE
jgi:hypothetical protein